VKSWSVVVLLAVGTACGGGEDAPEGAAPAEEAPKGQFLPKEVTTTAMEAATQLREPGKFVAEAGEFTVEVPVDRDTWKLALGLDVVALRLGDVPTLDYPIGFVKLDPLSLDGGDPTRDRTIVDVLLRNQGSPIQIFFDVHSVGEMKGRLPATGGSATGRVLGTLQIDDRQHDVDVIAHFERKDEEHLVLQIEPFDLPLDEMGLTPRLQALAKVLGKKHVGSTARVHGSVGLIAFHGTQLPTFARTPVTINRVEEFRQRLDDEIDDAEATRQKLLRTGTSGVVADSLGSRFLEEGQRILDERRTGGTSVLHNAAHDDR
jgi:hypothetical protein